MLDGKRAWRTAVIRGRNSGIFVRKVCIITAGQGREGSSENTRKYFGLKSSKSATTIAPPLAPQ